MVIAARSNELDAARLGDASAIGGVFKRNPNRGSLVPAIVTGVSERQRGADRRATAYL